MTCNEKKLSKNPIKCSYCITEAIKGTSSIDIVVNLIFDEKPGLKITRPETEILFEFATSRTHFLLRVTIKIKLTELQWTLLWVLCWPILVNSNSRDFTSPMQLEPLRFKNNSLDFGNDIDSSRESDFHVDFRRAV